MCYTSYTQSAKSNSKNLLVENITDGKDLKKLLRTKTNVLIVFYNSPKKAQSILDTMRDVARNIKGEGVIAVINCSG